MKKLLPFAIAALMIPSVALAKGPSPKAGTHTNQGKAKVMYVLKGMIYNYLAYDSSTNTPGSITIDVKHSNRHGRLLVGQTITVTLGANSKVLMENGVTSIAASQPGDSGMVKVRGPRMAFKGAASLDLQNSLASQPAHKGRRLGSVQHELKRTAFDPGTENQHIALSGRPQDGRSSFLSVRESGRDWFAPPGGSEPSE